MDERLPNSNVGVRDQAAFSSATPPSQSRNTKPGEAESCAQGAIPKQQPTLVIPQLAASGSHAQDHGLPSPVSFTWNDERTGTPSPCSAQICLRLCQRTAGPDVDLLHELFHYLKDEVGSEDIAGYFVHASLHPTITRESLAELSTSRIINNPKLRHDVNFDRELHFRPNLDGSKGRQKMKTADQFWKALQGEFQIYVLVQSELCNPTRPKTAEHWLRIRQISQKRLPNVFHAVRGILKTLVPDRDQDVILERLDVDLIMQQIQNGVCDLVELADWFAQVLKKHCAPMRDGMVDRMRRVICEAAAASDIARLVEGLRQLLTILEAMKLDVANHQIRHMRPLLIEDTVTFQRRYHAHRVATHKLDVKPARLWLEDEIQAGSGGSTLEALSSAVLRGLVFDEGISAYPQTFYLDTDRLRMFRMELRDTVFHDICAMVLCEVADPRCTRSQLVEAGKELRMAITDLVGASGNFLESVEAIAIEMMRSVTKMEGRAGLIDDALLGIIEHKLGADLSPESGAYDSVASETIDRLLPKLVASVEQHVRYPALALQDTLVPMSQPTSHTLGMGAMLAPPPTAPLRADPDDGLVRRMTHMIVLHWQVWADLAYLMPLPTHCDAPHFSRPASSSGSQAASLDFPTPSPSPMPRPLHSSASSSSADSTVVNSDQEDAQMHDHTMQSVED